MMLNASQKGIFLVFCFPVFLVVLLVVLHINRSNSVLTNLGNFYVFNFLR